MIINIIRTPPGILTPRRGYLGQHQFPFSLMVDKKSSLDAATTMTCAVLWPGDMTMLTLHRLEMSTWQGGGGGAGLYTDYTGP